MSNASLYGLAAGITTRHFRAATAPPELAMALLLW